MSPPATNGRAGWIHGKTVSDGIVNQLSVSSLQKAELCLRRWVYAYVHGYKDPETDATRRGVIRHAEVEKFLRTGSRAGLSAQVMSGMFMIPEPGPDLDVEWDILQRKDVRMELTAANSKALLLNAPLKAAGIPIAGFIDLKHARGTNKGTTDVTQAKDPPGTIEVLDWKFPGNMNNAKASHELIKTIQMAGYGKYVFNTEPDAKLVRLSHGYMPVKGRPAKSTVLVDRDQVEKSWESVEGLAGLIRDAAKETNPDLIDHNTRSCRAFGKDCPAMKVCKAAGHDSLSEIVGIVAAADELEIEPSPGETPPMSSLAEQLRKKKAAAESSKDSTKDVKSEMLKIARDEANAKFPGVMKTVAAITALGVGMPQLEGELAKAIGVLSDPPQQDIDTMKGEGELGEYACSTFDELKALLEEAAALLADAEPAPATPTEPPAKVEEVAANAIDEAASDAPKKKTRGKGAKKDPGGEATATDAAAKETSVKAEETSSSGAATSPPTEMLYFYVDCIPSVPYQSFWPVVFQAMNALAAKLSEDEKKIVPDPRLGDPNGKAGFGRWKPLISTYLKANAPKSGHWVLDGTYGEQAQEVAVAMREICDQLGGVFVRGMR